MSFFFIITSRFNKKRPLREKIPQMIKARVLCFVLRLCRFQSCRLAFASRMLQRRLQKAPTILISLGNNFLRLLRALFPAGGFFLCSSITPICAPFHLVSAFTPTPVRKLLLFPPGFWFFLLSPRQRACVDFETKDSRNVFASQRRGDHGGEGHKE